MRVFSELDKSTFEVKPAWGIVIVQAIARKINFERKTTISPLLTKLLDENFGIKFNPPYRRLVYKLTTKRRVMQHKLMLTLNQQLVL